MLTNILGAYLYYKKKTARYHFPMWDEICTDQRAKLKNEISKLKILTNFKSI